MPRKIDASATSYTSTAALFKVDFASANSTRPPVRFMASDQRVNEFDQAASRIIDMGNRFLDEHPEADDWEVASGLLAGAVQFWLFSRQPCGDNYCESCAEISTPDQRLNLLIEEIRQFAEESDYFHTPNDLLAGRA